MTSTYKLSFYKSLVLIYIYMAERCPQQELLANFGKKNLLLIGPGNYMAHLGSHSKVWGEDWGRVESPRLHRELGYFFYLNQG